MLKDERAQLKSLRNLYEDGRFCFIEENLNDVTKEFINSQLRNLQVQNMDELDNHCTLIFDEVSLGNGFQYDTVYQKTCGYEDLGSLGRTHNVANHALVFMVRGIRKSYKQVVAYYFTSDTVKTPHLKCLIVEIIKQIQSTGLQIVSTVCDQGPTNRAALRELCAENRDKPSPFYFMDSFIKMKVKVAANQLSHTVAASIETFSALGLLPSESLHTAEFVHDVDNLFDSLNGTVPLSKNQNCEDDNCTPLGDFCSFLLQQSAIDSNSSGSEDCDLTDLQCYSVEDNDNQDCEICRRHLYSPDVQQNHLFVTFKEYDDKQRLTYASDNVNTILTKKSYGTIHKEKNMAFITRKAKMRLI
ncbi:hypothetical protein NQ315_010852 [Exocentrus adspersus]|uniref:Uncharacterized protein n=1 Tax=Exocentrus adspersus TaxID=1586481 RepID=A0AAV8VBR3_9CUCU|nr:hypothetical protein NQ315_010852 [Exocentrus adspersus]